MQGQGLEDQLEEWRRRKKRHFNQLVITMIFAGVVGWFFWGYQELFGYAFFEDTPLVEMGNVAEHTPGDFVHNGYVRISGVTEHRGLTQKMVRGLGIAREDLWYFRLLGSGGVFVEVPTDKSQYGLATAIEVTGRVVDPTREPRYGPLLGLYQELFFPKQRSEIRIIQVGVVPGEAQGIFWGLSIFLLLLGVLNLVSLVRLIRVQFAKPG